MTDVFTQADAPDESPRFPCENCGAPLRYDPGADALGCPYCGHANPVPEAAAETRADALRELDLEDGLSGALSAAEHAETRVVPCGSCGAEVGFEGHEIARTCPWCAAPLSAAPVTHDALRPRGVLPFLVEEKQAREALKAWIGGRWFAPSGFAEFARADRPMDGLYMPAFTFDAQTRTRYTGMRGDAYYVSLQVQVKTDDGWRTETRQVRKIRWSPASGSVSRFFDDVLRPASRALAAEDFDTLGPWDLSALLPYDSRYLAGFQAETHSVPLKQAWGEARQVMDRTIRRDIRFDIGGDEQKITSCDTEHSAETFKHILVPVWLAAYRYRDKPYRVAVNGRTGRVHGERPWSVWKIALAAAVGLALAGAIGWLAAMHG